MKPGKRFQIDGGKCVEPERENDFMNMLANGTFLDDIGKWMSSDSICKINVISKLNFKFQFLRVQTIHRMAQPLDCIQRLQRILIRQQILMFHLFPVQKVKCQLLWYIQLIMGKKN